MFFSKLQTKFNTLAQTAWVNIFDSFKENIIDYNNDTVHPGIKSHQWMADQISNYLIIKNLK